MAAEDEVSEFLGQSRDTASWVESLRGECESDKLWGYRREFILRNLSDYCGDRLPPLETNNQDLDRLLSYSMVWVNHVFTGCRYPSPVMEKALNMADNIKVNDAPVHTIRDDLVSKVKKRGIASSNEGVEEPCKKLKPTEDVDLSELDISNNETAHGEPQHAVQLSERGSGALSPSTSGGQRTGINPSYSETSSHPPPVSAPTAKPAYGASIPAAARYEPEAPQEKNNTAECQQQAAAAKRASQSSANTAKPPRKLTVEDTKERQAFFNRLYKTVAWKLVSAGGFSPTLNHSELLINCIESLKSSLDIAFVPLKELADLPQNKTSQENIVCELRCQAVYLGMGCGKTKENAKAVASREAIKLFLKKKVVVRICKRKYSGRDVEDLVLLDEESRPINLPPALKNPQDLL
ncbi:CDKN2A-interacting [Pelobates cultripes]|uniref:CDKN2A-interacting n=1 Tax=Pelobates cultripes TaxID=61616 RepID=A0AAD1SF89_PELCU|nr:CDKN2A-interacting [Pelobates cultripes]